MDKSQIEIQKAIRKWGEKYYEENPSNELKGQDHFIAWLVKQIEEREEEIKTTEKLLTTMTLCISTVLDTMSHYAEYKKITDKIDLRIKEKQSRGKHDGNICVGAELGKG